jgi:hypothetical protein
MDIDLEIALTKLHQLQQDDGDLGAEYWLQVSELLREAATYRERALKAEESLRKNQILLEYMLTGSSGCTAGVLNELKKGK